MAFIPKEQDYKDFSKSLEGLSSTEQAAKVNEFTKTLHSSGVPVDENLKAKYVTPVMQDTVNANVGLTPTLTGGGSSATVGSGNAGVTTTGGSTNVTTGLNLAPTSGAPSMSVNQGPSSVTVGTQSPDTLQTSFPITGGTGTGGESATVEPGMGSTVTGVNTGVTPGITLPTAGITPTRFTPLPSLPPEGTDFATRQAVPDPSLYGRYSEEDSARILEARSQMTRRAEGTGTLPESQQVTAEQITESPDEIIDDPTTLGQVTTTTKQVGDPTQVAEPTSFEAETYEAAQTGDLGSVDFTAGKLSTDALVADIQGQVSEQSLVKAAQGTVSPEATVKFQMEDLMQSVEEGEPFPAWAAPAARSIGAIMQKRGLGTSSMASAALMQAVVESGIPIAAQDAQTYAQIDLQNLNNRQQAALQNAATYAAMDRANLDARMQAAITNAQSFLAIDLQNLTNEQRSRELEYQSNVQRMFNNQAADNAALQFNAQNQNQVDMFFAELATQVETANANRSAAAEQFNVSQANAMEQYTTSLNNARDQFNVSMDFQVDQSNAEWRRQINTINTAADNNANLQNVQNEFGASQNAIAQLWQEYRDELAWINTTAENAQARAHEITLYALQQANVLEQLDEQVENSVWERIGERIVDRVIPV